MRWCVLLLASTVAFAETPDPARQCKPVGQVTIDAAAAKLRNEARFRDALAKRGLRSVTAVREATTVTQKVVASTVVSLRRSGRDVRFVVGPIGGEWEFAVNARGDVFAIERKPIHRGSAIPVACGCEPTTASPPKPGASRYLYMLPDNAVFGGVLVIDYPADVDHVVFNHRQRDGSYCPFLPTTADPFSVHQDFALPRGWRDLLLEDPPRMSPMPSWQSRLVPEEQPAYIDWPLDW